MATVATKQNGPEPNGQVCGIEIRTSRRSIPFHLDRSTCECVANKVADGEVTVQRQIGPNEGKATSNLGFQSVTLGIDRTQQFRDPFSFPVRRTHIHGARRASVVFGNMRDFWWLLPVDSAGACQQKLAGAAVDRKAKG